MRTVLVGKFRDGVMLEARASYIVAERCNDGIKEIKLSNANKMYKKEIPVYSFNRNTRLRIYKPTLMDPFEKNTVFIKTNKEKGDGLFARRDIDPFEIVAYYSGTIWPKNDNDEPGNSPNWLNVPANQTEYERYCQGIDYF